MAGRSGRRRVDPSSPLVDLDQVFADDNLVDAIAARPWGEPERHPFTAGRSGAGSARTTLLTVDPLAELLESWRSELAVRPLPPVPTTRSVLRPGRSRPAPRTRAIRPAMAIAAAIAGLLVGAASIGSKDASPDSALWAITRVMWPDRAESIASVEHVHAALDEARAALADGRHQDAQLALLRATVELGSVDNVDGRDDMQQTVATMWVEASSRTASSTTTAPMPEFVMRAPASTAGPDPTTAAVAGSSDPTSPGVTAPPTSDPVVPAQLAAAPAADASVVQPPAALAVAPSADNAGSAVGSVDASTPGAADVPGGSTAVAADSEPPAVTDAEVPPPATPDPPSVSDTPVPPMTPADPPAAVSPPDPPSATEQSAPAPTPSGPAQDPTTPTSAEQVTVDPASAEPSMDTVTAAGAAG